MSKNIGLGKEALSPALSPATSRSGRRVHAVPNSIRIAVGIIDQLFVAAEVRNWTLADEVHCRLEKTLHLHDGEGVLIGGQVITTRPGWRARRKSHGLTHVYLRDTVNEKVAVAAKAAQMTPADWVNIALFESLSPAKK